MATLIPNDLRNVTNESERNVIDRLQRELGPEWLLIPSHRLTHLGQDFEIDLIVIHKDHGIAIIEVKGGNIGLERGVWQNIGDRKDPVAQASGNSYELAGKLSTIIGNPTLKVAWSIALPKSMGVSGMLPSGLLREQLLTGPDLDNAEGSLVKLFAFSHHNPFLSEEQITALVNYFCPDADFHYDERAFDKQTRERLRTICETQVRTLASLDAHHRVLVSGRAGTGKTYLACEWTKAGLLRDVGENPKRVLLTCYNDPLAQRLQQDLHYQLQRDPDDDEAPTLRVDSVLRVFRDLDGMPPLQYEGPEDSHYWSAILPGHLQKHWHHVTERFDRIVVDEAQDFAPAWLGMLESLLDPAGDNKLFLLSDTEQELVPRGFSEPTIASGWVRAALHTNVRNARGIARLARTKLGGAEAPQSLPATQDVGFVEAATQEALVARVSELLQSSLESGIAQRDILVIASDSSTRDALRDQLKLTSATDERIGAIACETPYRSKGLEYPIVILAIGEKSMSRAERYVAVTRAIQSLTVIARSSELLEFGAAG